VILRAAAVAVGVLTRQLGEQRRGEGIVLGYRDEPQLVRGRHRHALSNAHRGVEFRRANFTRREHKSLQDPALPHADLTPVKSLVMDNINGRTIAITGAARGIGHATAEALLKRGARVVIGDRDVDTLESAVTGLQRLGPVAGHPLDVTSRDSFAAFLDKARSEGGGRIDVLINNAGVMPIGPFLQQSEQAIRSAIEVNFYGVLNGCQLALPEMVKRRSGHIINIASLSGLIPVKTLDKPKTHVSVPAALRFVAATASMLGPRGRRWLNKRLGLDRVFLDFDTTARKEYEERAQQATGVIEHRD
jgi:hypothetical protein